MFPYNKCKIYECCDVVHISELGKHIYCKSHLHGKNIYDTVHHEYNTDGQHKMEKNNLLIAIKKYLEKDNLINITIEI